MFWQECKEVGAFLSMSDWLTAMAALQSGFASDHLCLLADTIVLAESITKLLRFHLIYHVTLNSRDTTIWFILQAAESQSEKILNTMQDYMDTALHRKSIKCIWHFAGCLMQLLKNI